MLAAGICLPAGQAVAQGAGDSILRQAYPQAGEKRERPNQGLEMPEFHYQPPSEPVFEKVEYQKLEPPLHLQERIERLIHGIKVDIPPEYDHYGYEIRRYMARVAGPKVLASQKNIEGQLQNIKNAEIILKYWRDTHAKEIAAIEAEIEASNSSSYSTSFKYHRGVANAFFVEAGSWMNNNRAVLEYLQELGPQGYTFRDGKIKFGSRKELTKFLALFKAQREALEIIQGYTPFRMMVY